jgi:hypothetical protein
MGGAMSVAFESADALNRCNRMWLRLGRALERQAYERSKHGNPIDCRHAIGFAKDAERCFWQATGDAEAFNFSGYQTDEQPPF